MSDVEDELCHTLTICVLLADICVALRKIAGMGGEHSMQLVSVTQPATAEAGMCSNVPAI